MRDYPPAHTIHEVDCTDAPAGLFPFRVHNVPFAYPNARAHTACISHETVRMNREVVAEPGDYEPHPYEASAERPADAARPLCRTCGGTHGDVLAELMLP